MSWVQWLRQKRKVSDIKIYQIYYREDQVISLDRDFVPYDNSRGRDLKWAEYGIFLREYEQKKHKENEYVGFVSYRFGKKTRLTGLQFLDFMQKNRGYDVYFVNYYPLFGFQNVWEQGEMGHNGITKFMQVVFDKLNYGIDIEKMVNTAENTLFSNYWVGNEFFWDEYMKFTRPIYEYINNSMTADEKGFIEGKTKHHIGGGRNVKYHFNEHPFVMERLFSTLLVHNKSIRALAYRYSDIELLLQHEYWNLYFEHVGLTSQYEKLKKRFDELAGETPS